MKIPLYSGIHKGQRKWLFEISTQAGRTDFSNRQEVDRLLHQVKALLEHMKEHAYLEENYIHPRLAGIVPGCPRGIEADHKAQHQDLEDLIKGLEMIKEIPPDHETLPSIGHEQYLALNRYISAYLKHIDFEEDHVQQIMLNDCTAEELMAIFKKIIDAQEPPVLISNVNLMLDAMSMMEITGIVMLGKSILPAPTYQQVLAHLESTMDKEKWAALKSRLGL